MESNYDKHIVRGIMACFLLLVFYILVMSLLSSFSFALANFAQLWYWMIPLVVGFGVQIGMFSYVREVTHRNAAGAATCTGVSVTSSSMSAVSMVACCAHHIADIAPFLGITTFGLFFTKYQPTLLLIGILSNLLGISYMSSMLHTRISKYKIKSMFYLLLVLSIAIVFVSYTYLSKNEETTVIKSNVNFQTLTSYGNNVEFQVTPLSASEFWISINTHSVDLNFDLTEISTLYDYAGNVYKPILWEGSPPGGHHRTGTLKFPKIYKDAKSIKLSIIDNTRREFSWNLE